MKSILFLITLVLTIVAHAADLPRVAVVRRSPERSQVRADFSYGA